ncbi:hypothetical protein [Hymenobacter daeguensis]
MASIRYFVLLFSGFAFFVSCTPAAKYKRDLLSDDKTKIDEACYELGEAKDTSAIKLLLTKALDPRISHNLRFYGMTVNYCRLGALKKISGIDNGQKIDRFWPDTAATLFYLNWAVENGYLKDTGEVNIYYYKE